MRALASLPILVLLGFGYLLRLIGFFKESTVTELRKFILVVSLPALIFRSFLSLEIQLKHSVMIVVVYLLCLAMLLYGRFISKVARISNPYFPILMAGFEMGMFGYALFMSFYGAENLGRIAFLGIGQTLFVFTILFSQLMQLREHSSMSLYSSLRNFFTNPISIAMLAGIIIGRIPVPACLEEVTAILSELLALVSAVTVPLVTILIGYSSRIEKRVLTLSIATIITRKVGLVTLVLLINHFIVERLLGMQEIYRQALIVMALTPPTFLSAMLVRFDDEKSAAYTSTTISLDCLVSIGLVMIAISFQK